MVSRETEGEVTEGLGVGFSRTVGLLLRVGQAGACASVGRLGGGPSCQEDERGHRAPCPEVHLFRIKQGYRRWFDDV